MARARKRSDDVYNARRRYRRQAERYMREAEKSSGVQARRYRAAAKQVIESAQALYAKGSKPQGRVAEVAEELGSQQQVFSERRRTEAMQRSREALVSRTDTVDAVARAILSTNIGSRIYGGLVEVWRGKPDREQAIMEFFGVDSLSQVLERVEEIAPELYDVGETSDSVVYDAVTVRLQAHVARQRS